MALELCGPCPHCFCWPRSLLPAGVTGTGGCHLGIQPWYVQVYPEAATADTGPKAFFNRKQEHLMAMLPPHALCTQPILHGHVHQPRAQGTALCRAEQRRRVRPDAREFQILLKKFFFALKGLQCGEQSSKTTLHSKYFLCHFPASHTPAWAKLGQDEALPCEPQGWSVYNYSISIQRVTRHLMNIIIKKLINLISGAEKNSPR